MTNIVGKDAPLEVSIERFRAGFKKLNLEVSESGWLNPLPNVFSVHLEFPSCPSIYSNGKGSSKLAALASAYGELYERLATHTSFSDYYLGLENSESPYVQYPDEHWSTLPADGDTSLPPDILNASLRKFYTKDLKLSMEDLVDVQASSFSRGVCSLPFTNARNGETVYFPVNLLNNLYASNGMSAGNSDYEALVQALSELLERHVKKEIIKKGLSLPEIPSEIIERYPKSGSTLQELQGHGFSAKAYDASLGGRFPVVCVVLFNQSNGTCCAAFGAHPIFEVALDRTLTELLQGRTFSDLDGFEAPVFDLNQCADDVNLVSHFVDSTGLIPIQMFRRSPDFKFTAWDFRGNTHDQYKALRYIIAKLGFDIYLRAYKQMGIPVYRVIVPGMSEVYPLDDLVYNNTNAFIDFQQALLALPDFCESRETYEGYYHELEDSGCEDEASVAQTLGVMADPGTPWETLRFGELKCLLALAGGLKDEALNWCRWTLGYCHDDFPLSRLRFYRCLEKALECICEYDERLEDYNELLNSLYGIETADAVRAHIAGEQRFFALLGTDLNLKGFKAHEELIRIFKIVKEAALNVKNEVSNTHE